MVVDSESSLSTDYNRPTNESVTRLKLPDKFGRKLYDFFKKFILINTDNNRVGHPNRRPVDWLTCH